jgi:hypothetical protein
LADLGCGKGNIPACCHFRVRLEYSLLLLGTVPAVIVFGAYFMGFFRPGPKSLEWREFFKRPWRALTWKGFLWSLALPLAWIVIYNGLVANIWLGLGRWPRFGERLTDWWLLWHNEAVKYFLAALVGSLYTTAIVFVACLFLRRWRHICIYVVCYAAGVGIAWAALFLAPKPFLNWLLD